MRRAGGNAVDAAVACVLMDFVAESPLTGPGAGGFMLVHVPDGGTHLLDFFVAAPGEEIDDPEPAALISIGDRLGGRDPALQRCYRPAASLLGLGPCARPWRRVARQPVLGDARGA